MTRRSCEVFDTEELRESVSRVISGIAELSAECDNLELGFLKSVLLF